MCVLSRDAVDHISHLEAEQKLLTSMNERKTMQQTRQILTKWCKEERENRMEDKSFVCVCYGIEILHLHRVLFTLEIVWLLSLLLKPKTTAPISWNFHAYAHTHTHTH